MTYRPRLTADITEEQANLLSEALPRGVKGPLFQVLVEGIIEIYKLGGYEAIGSITSKYISIEQLSDIGIRAFKRKNKNELKLALEKLEKI